MTAFEVCVSQFLDECEIEIVENQKLPLVVDQRNPYYMAVEFRSGLWWCEAKFQCRENPDEFVHIRRCFSPELIANLSMFYDGEGDEEEG